jgi:PHD/YefM family antitoxin component YafN of YafNO toxin-antitoxin module
MDIMTDWMTGEAKQRFSEVLRRSEEAPQRIYRRDRLVAAVISAEAFEEYRRWREESERRTLADAFDEVRELAARYDWELDTGKRVDRPAWVDESE